MPSSFVVRRFSVQFVFFLQSGTALRMMSQGHTHEQGTSQKPFWKFWGSDKNEDSAPEIDTFATDGLFKDEGDLDGQVEVLTAEVRAAQRPVEAKIAEMTSLEGMASRIAEQRTELETDLELLGELDSSKDEEIMVLKTKLEDLEASKQAASEQRAEHMASRGDRIRHSREALAAIKDLDRQRAKLEPQFVELRKSIDAATAKERSLQSKMDSVAKYNVEVSTISGETDRLLAEAVERKAALDTQLYDAKQLMDNMNKNKVLKQTLIQGKDREMATLVDNLKSIDKGFQQIKADRVKHNKVMKDKGDAKVALQHQIDALDAKANDLQINRPKNWQRAQMKLDEKRTSLEKQFNQLDYDIDMMDMDGVTSTKQVTARSSEKATAQQHLKEVEREKAALEIQVVALGKESEGKAKDIAKITNELRAAEQGIEKLKGQKQTYELTLEDKGSGLAALKDQMQKVQDEKAKYLQAMAELEHSTDELSQRALAQQELEKASHEEADAFTAQATEQWKLEQDAAPQQTALSDSIKKAELDQRRIREELARKQMKLDVKTTEKDKLEEQLEVVHMEKDRLAALKMEKQAMLDQKVAEQKMRASSADAATAAESSTETAASSGSAQEIVREAATDVDDGEAVEESIEDEDSVESGDEEAEESGDESNSDNDDEYLDEDLDESEDTEDTEEGSDA